MYKRQANDNPKRIEAIKIRLKGTQAENYDIYYRVYTSNYGWLGWAKNDEESGTKGYDCQAEAIQIVAGKKGMDAPGSTENAFVEKDPTVSYTCLLYTSSAWDRSTDRIQKRYRRICKKRTFCRRIQISAEKNACLCY